MNSTLALNHRHTKQTASSRGGWMRYLVWAASIPLGLLLIGGVAIGVSEFQATSELQAKVNHLKQAGVPYDCESLDEWYRRRTHPEGAQAWVQILDSVSATSQLAVVENLPIVGNGKGLVELDPQSKWRDEPTVNEFLTEMQGLIQQIHQLKKWPTPVQLPLEIHGAQTLLPHYQQSRSLTHLLALDFEYAFYHKEFDRALEDLRSMGTVVKAIDTDFCMVVELIVMATVGVQNQEIQRSLFTDSWPAEKLIALREIVGDVRFTPTKWKAWFANERAMNGDVIASGDLSRITGTNEASLVPLFQTGRLRIFDAYDSLINVGDSPLTSLKSRSESATKNLVKRDATFDIDGGNIWIGLMFPAADSMARAVENVENNRRLTVTAIALRQFKLQEGRWPNHLRELEKVGLTADDISTLNHGGLGYEVEGDVAFLWGGKSTEDSPVSAARPADLSERNDGQVLVTLR